jgi:hypothetical protein
LRGQDLIFGRVLPPPPLLTVPRSPKKIDQIGPIEIPSPSEVDEQWRMEGTKSDVDKLVTYWKVTKGGFWGWKR